MTSNTPYAGRQKESIKRDTHALDQHLDIALQTYGYTGPLQRLYVGRGDRRRPDCHRVQAVIDRQDNICNRPQGRRRRQTVFDLTAEQD